MQFHFMMEAPVNMKKGGKKFVNQDVSGIYIELCKKNKQFYNFFQ